MLLEKRQLVGLVHAVQQTDLPERFDGGLVRLAAHLYVLDGLKRPLRVLLFDD